MYIVKLSQLPIPVYLTLFTAQLSHPTTIYKLPTWQGEIYQAKSGSQKDRQRSTGFAKEIGNLERKIIYFVHFGSFLNNFEKRLQKRDELLNTQHSDFKPS